MIDLANRLRERAQVARSEKTGTALGDALHFEEAADRIEALEAELEAAHRLYSEATSLIRTFS